MDNPVSDQLNIVIPACLSLAFPEFPDGAGWQMGLMRRILSYPGIKYDVDEKMKY